MKLKDDLILQPVDGGWIVVPVGTRALDMRSVFTLNETGAFLWERLQAGATAEDLKTALLAEYDVTPEAAEQDIAAFVDRVRTAGLLDE